MEQCLLPESGCLPIAPYDDSGEEHPKDECVGYGMGGRFDSERTPSFELRKHAGRGGLSPIRVASNIPNSCANR